MASLDGSSLDVADTVENGACFGCSGGSRGESTFLQLRFVALVENGTYVPFSAKLGRYADSETTLAHNVVMGGEDEQVLAVALDGPEQLRLLLGEFTTARCPPPPGMQATEPCLP